MLAPPLNRALSIAIGLLLALGGLALQLLIVIDILGPGLLRSLAGYALVVLGIGIIAGTLLRSVREPGSSGPV